MNDLTELEITKEDLEKLTEEELVDIKVRLENLLMECEEILQEDTNIEEK